jgi:hypothetical protein
VSNVGQENLKCIESPSPERHMAAWLRTENPNDPPGRRHRDSNPVRRSSGRGQPMSLRPPGSGERGETLGTDAERAAAFCAGVTRLISPTAATWAAPVNRERSDRAVTP